MALSRNACNTRRCLFDRVGGACSEAARVLSIVRDVKAKPPGISAEGLTWLHKAVEQGLTAGGEDRGVLTFRRIAHHYDGSGDSTRCPSLPAPCAPGAASIFNISPSPAADVDSADEVPVDSVRDECL